MRNATMTNQQVEQVVFRLPEREQLRLARSTVDRVLSRDAKSAGHNQYRRNRKIGLGDALIAGTAFTHNATIYTRNIKDCPMDDIDVRVPYERGR